MDLYPQTTDQEAETNVMVEDGKILVIGGLIMDQKRAHPNSFHPACVGIIF